MGAFPVVPLAAAAGFAVLATAALAEDVMADVAFRTCVMAEQNNAVTTSYHHCTGLLAADCGAAATAKDAVECIRGVRARVEARIAHERALLPDDTDKAAEIEFYLTDNRAAGESSCAMMANQDAATGLAVGQRAVNGAFCDLIVSGDVYALILQLRAAK